MEDAKSQQTKRNPRKEQREAKATKTYVGNGKIFWTDGKINIAEKVERESVSSSSSEDDLPF